MCTLGNIAPASSSLFPSPTIPLHLGGIRLPKYAQAHSLLVWAPKTPQGSVSPTGTEVKVRLLSKELPELMAAELC